MMRRTAFWGVALTLAATPLCAQGLAWGSRPIAEVERAARRDDKTAALELGRRYEAGRDGVRCDIGKARKWYARAARTTGGKRPVYSAPVGSERYGRLIELGGAPVVPGLPEAQRRLDALQAAPGLACRAIGINSSSSRTAATESASSTAALIDGFLVYRKSLPSYAGVKVYFKAVSAAGDASLAILATPPAPVPGSSATANRASLSNLSDGELKSYLAATDVLRLPFDSTIATIKQCLRRSEVAIRPCLEAGSRDQACETDIPQCATAAEQAWQVYIAHFRRLLGAKVPTISSIASQQAWMAYVNAECSFQSSIYPDDAAMRATVFATCRAIKAQERTLELRSSLINAYS